MTYRNFKVYKGWHVRTLNYANSLQRNTKVCKEWHIKGFEVCKKWHIDTLKYAKASA